MKPIEEIRCLENLDFYPFPKSHEDILTMAKDGFSVKEIAEKMEMSASSVNSAISQIIIRSRLFDGDNRWNKVLSSRAANTLKCMRLRSRIEARFFFENNKFNYNHYGMGKKTADEIKEWAHYDPSKPTRKYIFVDGARYSSAE